MKRRLLSFFAVTIALAMASNAFAGTLSWTNGGGDRHWDNSSNWNSDAGPLPTAGDKANIGSGATPTTGPIISGTMAAVSNQIDLGGSLGMTGGTLETNDWMLVGYGGTSVGTFNISGGSYTQLNNRTCFGFGATGHLNMTGGAIDITNNHLYFGTNPSSVGHGTVDAGTIISNRLYVGHEGTGHLTLNGGTISTRGGNDIYVGSKSSSEGHVTVNGGTLNPGRDIKVGDNGEGHLTITGGLVDSRHLYSGYNGTADGYITMSGGTLDADDVILGKSGTCEMTMTAGEITNIDDLEIGQSPGSNGKLTMSGGSITPRGGDGHNMLIGNAAGATGELVMSDGYIKVSGLLYVGHNGDGTINMTGGEIDATASMVIGRNDGSKGTVLLHGGMITANAVEMQWAGATTADPTLDITEGTLILSSTGTFLGYIDDGYITAYGGAGTFNYDTVSIEGKTVITAEIPEPASIVLVLFGALGLLGLRRRK